MMRTLSLIIVIIILGLTSAHAQKAPPLVLEADRYSYTFAVPNGWDFSFDQATEVGVRLVFFPEGGSFHSSDTIIYVNEICKSSCGGSLEGAISKSIQDARAGNPKLKIETAPSLKTKGGNAVPVRILSGAQDVRQAREALAFIDTQDVVVLPVLTTKDPKSWEADYAAFRRIVEGFKYFDCNSPELAVKCR